MPNIDQILIEESGRIGPEINRRVLNTSPWLKLTKQDKWPDEMGNEVSLLVYERSLPQANALTWTTLTTNSGAGNSCVPTAATVNFGQTLRTYNLQQTALESPPICVNDMRFPLKRREQVSNIMQILTENTRNVWIDRYRDEYTRIASHKVIATTALPESSASFPLTVPTSRLTQGILDRIYMKLIRDGAGMEPMGRENGRPVFTLITGPETSERVVVDGASIQTDFRYSTRVNELLQPLGVERSYKGFYHLIDDFPPRYDFVGGAWVRRWPWASEAATQGNKWEIDADYENAAYEDSFIFIPSVYTSLIPAPITSVGPLTFDSTNYRGDFKWKNIMDRVENPDGNWGYFRGIFANGSRPDNPQWGYVIRHQRCTSDLGLVVCS